MLQFPPLPDWFWYPITFLYGAIVGSFLNVVIYRLPIGRNVWGESSHCPNCNHYLRAWDNIPILGFLFAGGKCRYCKIPISWRYISVELLTACLWVALYDRVSGQSSISWVDYVFQALFASVLVALIFIDLDHFFAPDELNVVGFVLALGRDIVCLIMAWRTGGYVWQEWGPRFSYFGFLPRAIPGALVYGGLLFVVSVVGFLYYTHEPGESLFAGMRRFRTYLTEEPEEDTVIAEGIETAEAAEGVEVEAVPTVPIATTPLPEAPTEILTVDPVQAEIESEEEYDIAPPRLRFSPGVISVVAAALLATVAGWWGLLATVIPALCYLGLARRSGESVGSTLRRFFQPDEDDDYAQDDPALQQAAEDASQFAKEAETGAHGGMGFGDVKLALAIGALLGPVLAVLSLFVATFVGAAVGITIAIRQGRRNLKYGVPFIPFMAVGAIVTMLYGQAFIDWYATLLAPPETRIQQRMPMAFPQRRIRPGSRPQGQPVLPPH